MLVQSYRAADAIGSAAPEFSGLAGIRRSSSPCPAASRCRATAFVQLQIRVGVRGPDVFDLP